MSNDQVDPALTYTSYLAVDELLALQRPLSDGPEHDEMLLSSSIRVMNFGLSN